MILLSCAGVTDRIAVVGAQSLDYLVALCRLGFEAAVCISGEHACACSEPVDHLFVTGVMKEDRVALVVSSIARRLNDNGTIVASLRNAGQDQIISMALDDIGFANSRPVFDSTGLLLVSHRKSRPDQFEVAA